MRILLDECIDFSISLFLSERGFDTLHVKETQWKGLSNSKLYKEAQSDFNLFVTSDRDFRNPLEYPPTTTMSVVYIRIVPPILN